MRLLLAITLTNALALAAEPAATTPVGPGPTPATAPVQVPLAPPAPALAPPTAEEIAQAGRWTAANIITPRGVIRVRLFPATAPLSVANFVKLAQTGFYDGTAFHRVEPGFVIQGGDPNSRPGATGRPGMGGPGYRIKAEVGPANPEKHLPGTLAMARSMDLDSAGSQFYLTLATTPHLDGGYTVFGRIADPADLAVIQAIRPNDPMRVEILPPKP